MVPIQFFRLPPRVSHRTNRARLRLRIMEFELAAHIIAPEGGWVRGGFSVGETTKKGSGILNRIKTDAVSGDLQVCS